MSVGIAAIIAKEICKLEEVIRLEDEAQKSLSLNSTFAVVSRQQHMASSNIYHPIGKYIAIGIVSAISAAFLVYMAVTITKLFRHREPNLTEQSHISQNKKWPKSRHADLENQHAQVEVEVEERGREMESSRQYGLGRNDGMFRGAGNIGYRAYSPIYGPRIYAPNRPTGHGLGSF